MQGTNSFEVLLSKLHDNVLLLQFYAYKVKFFKLDCTIGIIKCYLFSEEAIKLEYEVFRNNRLGNMYRVKIRKLVT